MSRTRHQADFGELFQAHLEHEFQQGGYAHRMVPLPRSMSGGMRRNEGPSLRTGSGRRGRFRAAGAAMSSSLGMTPRRTTR
jgi:hypothetical protein